MPVPDVDAVVVGGGHNGLTAAAYLARAGRSVVLLERGEHTGGVAVSERPFVGVDALVSRYSYLVSLMPVLLRDELGLDLRLVRRRISAYTPVGDTGVLVDRHDGPATAASFLRATGDRDEFERWRRWNDTLARVAAALWPTVTGPLPTAAEIRGRLGADLWHLFAEEPIAAVLESSLHDDTVRGVALTDALIGTFAEARSAGLLQNRCFLYHVIGGGTGDWDVPVGGMGAVSAALERVARQAGADLRTGASVTGIDPDTGEVGFTVGAGEHAVRGEHIVAAVPPTVLAGLLGDDPPPPPRGSQLKINMLLNRLPALKDPDVDPQTAFAGTFHVNEGYAHLQQAYEEAAAGRIPTLPPCEVYCHSLSDGSILGPDLRAAGAHTLTLFGLHMPIDLFGHDPDRAREQALTATMASIDAVLAEPLAGCLALDAQGRPCVEVRTPVDLEREAGLPGGHIFHGDLSWPWLADGEDAVGDPAVRWGVATAHPRIVHASAGGARRGGGVSGLGGRDAAMALLGR